MKRIYFVSAVAGVLGWCAGGVAGDNYRLNREIKKCQDPHCLAHKKRAPTSSSSNDSGQNNCQNEARKDPQKSEDY